MSFSGNKRCVTILLAVFCYACIGNSAFCQNKDQDLALANQLKTQFGDKNGVVCLSSSTVITFDSIGGMHKANLSTTEKFISLKDNYMFTNVLGCGDYIDVSDVRVFDHKNKPLYTEVIDQSNEEGENFYSDEKLRVFRMYFESMGSRMSYESQTIITDLKYLTQIYLINFYPIVYNTITFKVPIWLNIDLKEMNFEGYDIQKTVTHDDANQLTIYTFVVKNMAAGHFNENEVPGNSYMFPHILAMCKSYYAANAKNINIISSVDDMYQWYEKLIKEAKNDDEPLKPIVSELIKGKTNDLDKAKAIYYWVEDNIRYVAFENGIVGYKPAPCQTVLKNRYGDCKCMANLLTEMLKIAGLDARRAWLGTKEIIYDMSTPSLAMHNHAICVLVYNKKYYYLDATEGYASLGLDNDMIQGRDIVIENGNACIKEHIPIAPIENNETVINKTLSLNGDVISGDAHYSYIGDSKTRILYEYNHLPNTDKERDMKYFIQHHDPNITLSESKTSDLNNRDIPITINYNFSIKNQVNQFDKDTYISIDYDKVLEHLEFDSLRYCDYEFDSKINYAVNDTLIVPQGYTVKHIPENLTITTPDYSFIVKVLTQGDKIVYHKEVKVLNEIIKVKHFQEWNKAVKQLKDICEDQVILTKA